LAIARATAFVRWSVVRYEESPRDSGLAIAGATAFSVVWALEAAKWAERRGWLSEPAPRAAG
jgi:hypothetical protein